MELVEKLRRRRSLVDDHGSSFESTPNKRTADDGVSTTTNTICPSPEPPLATPTSGRKSGQRRNFEEVIAYRKSLTDQSATTFESKSFPEHTIFAQTGLPPSPTRARKSWQPPSMPPPPPPTPAGVGSSTKKETNQEQVSYDDSLRRNIMTDLAEESAGMSTSPKFAAVDYRLSSSSLVVYPDQVVWEASLTMNTPVNSPLFNIKGCKWPSCLQFLPKGLASDGKRTYVLALRSWQPRETRMVVALFAGSETMSQREWIGPVIDSDFTVETTDDSACNTVTCGFHYRSES